MISSLKLYKVTNSKLKNDIYISLTFNYITLQMDVGSSFTYILKLINYEKKYVKIWNPFDGSNRNGFLSK
jgi:hypothetical protein